MASNENISSCTFGNMVSYQILCTGKYQHSCYHAVAPLVDGSDAVSSSGIRSLSSYVYIKNVVHAEEVLKSRITPHTLLAFHGEQSHFSSKS